MKMINIYPFLGRGGRVNKADTQPLVCVMLVEWLSEAAERHITNIDK